MSKRVNDTHTFLTKYEMMLRAMMTVWVTTHEEERFLVLLRELIPELESAGGPEFKVLSWSLTEGLLDLMPYLKIQPGGMYRQPERIGMTAPAVPDRYGIAPPPGQSQPLTPVIDFGDFCEYFYQNCANKLFIIKDVHNLLDKARPTYPTFVRKIRDLIYHNRSSVEGDAGYITFLAPLVEIPTDLEKDIQTLDMPLPNDHDIGKTIDEGLSDFRSVNAALKIDIPFTDRKGKLIKSKNVDGEVLRNQAIFNLKGLTKSEISQVINYSTVANNGLHGNFLADIREQKRQIIEETGFLEFLDIPDIVGVGGHDTFKAYVARRGLYLIPKYREAYSLKPPRGTLLMGIPGCQPFNSKVLMADGNWKAIQDVQKDDCVMSPQPDGSVTPIKVIDTVSYDDRDIYEVKTTGKRELLYLCSGNHVLPILRQKSLRKGNLRKHISVIDEMTVEEYVQKSPSFKMRSRLFTTPAYDLPQADLKIHPYVMGCILGDGSIKYGKNSGITYSEEIILQKMVNYGATVGKIVKKNNSNCKYRSFNKEYSQKIQDYFKPETNCYNKFIPDDYKKGSLEQRLQLLAGMVDTDGTSEEYTTVSSRLATDFVELIHSIGGRATFKRRTTSCNGKTFWSYRVHYSTAEYQIPTNLAYKRNNVRNIVWKNPRNQHFKVTKIGIDKVYGFTLEKGSQWYITDDFIVTHNTGKSILARYIAWKWAVPLIRLDMSAIMGSLLGQSEGRINEALKIADANAPCILFIDEVEKAVGDSTGDSGTSSRIFGKLLTWMSERKEMVYLFCTANKINKLPGEFLRPGRFDKIFWTDLPDVAECRDILGIHANLNNIELPNDDLFDIAKYCWENDMTGAEIEQGVIDANVAVAERAMMIGQDIKVGPEAVKACLEEIRPKMKTNPEGYTDLRIKALKDFDFTSNHAYERLKKQFQNR